MYAAYFCDFISEEIIMRHLALLATAILIIANSSASAAPLPSGLPRLDNLSVIERVQDKPKKDETLTQKVKRVWRNLTGYKFAVTCPALPIPLVTSRATCTETGKNREDARAKCQSRYPLCAVADAR
jgi:hypothetical protein